MIDLGSIAGLYEREHELHAYCHHCDRWRVLDLGEMVRRGWQAIAFARPLPMVRCGGHFAGPSANAGAI